MLKAITLFGEQKKVLFLPVQNPIQIKGVAGSGKTTVALYRAKHLLETQGNLFQESKVVIFTFNRTLANYIQAIRPLITGGYSAENDSISPKSPAGLNVHVTNFHKWAFHFTGISRGQTIEGNVQKNLISLAIFEIDPNAPFDNKHNVLKKHLDFFVDEISWIKGNLINSLREYLQAKRVGRGTADRITAKDREVIWKVFQQYQKLLNDRAKIDFDDYAILALDKITNSDFTPPFTHIIIDEAQDLNKAQILVLSQLVTPETNSISIIADAAQRIYKSGFVWSEVGLNVRGGRTIEFKKNYRNTIQIANAALSLLEKEQDKSDFTEVEQGIRDGKKPRVGYFDDYMEQANQVLSDLQLLKDTDQISSTVILSRKYKSLERIQETLKNNGYDFELIKNNSHVNYNSDCIKLSVMSSIKGLEFNNVIIIDLNEDIIPSPEGLSGDNDDYHISTERRLLYTSMTRARNNLFLYSSDDPSNFLDEIDVDLLSLVTFRKSSRKENLDLPF